MRPLFATVTFAVLILLALKTSTVHAREDNTKAEFYTTRVKPILDQNCARCHAGTNHRGGLNMDTKESLLKGGHDGPAIVPGDPAKSLLVTLIRHEGPKDDPKNMPPKGDKLSDTDIKVIEDWVKGGATMPVPTAK
jgi:mono/diheme cytochrome c family protein